MGTSVSSPKSARAPRPVQFTTTSSRVVRPRATDSIVRSTTARRLLARRRGRLQVDGRVDHHQRVAVRVRAGKRMLAGAQRHGSKQFRRGRPLPRDGRLRPGAEQIEGESSARRTARRPVHRSGGARPARRVPARPRTPAGASASSTSVTGDHSAPATLDVVFGGRSRAYTVTATPRSCSTRAVARPTAPAPRTAARAGESCIARSAAHSAVPHDSVTPQPPCP